MAQSISVLTATLNCRGTLPACIASVAAQKEGLLEHIVIDARSTDGTLGILARAAKEHPGTFRFVSEADSGIYDALNKGLAIARGDWIYVLGADDVLYDEHVFAKVLKVTAQADYDLVFGDVLYGAKGNSSRLSFADFSPNHLARYMPSHQGLFVHKRVLEKHGPFGTKYPLGEDYHLLLRIFGDAMTRWHYLAEPIAYYSASGRSSQLIDREFYKDFPALFHKYLELKLSQADRWRCFYMANKPRWLRPQDWILNVRRRLGGVGNFSWK